MAYDSPRDFHAEAAEIVAAQAAAWLTPSFKLHGWAHADQQPPETVEAVVERLQAEEARRQAWRKSSRGRFVLACLELCDLGFHEADAAYSAACRNFRDAREAVDLREVGVALQALASINHSTAREALAALAEIVGGVA